jgi:predicted ATPase
MAESIPYVFISYASADRERVLPIVAALRDAGVACWIDQHDIEGGANWGMRITEAIEGCAALVLMSSASSLASRNVRQEVAIAWKFEKPYLPLLLDATPVPTEMIYWLETAQWVEVLEQPASEWLPKVQTALARTTATQPAAQLGVPGAPTRPVTSLPSPPSSFVGREQEVAEIAALLHGDRIVTMLGPGGIGKTRIAITVGHRLAQEYADGVTFVDLAPLRDPTLVLPTIAGAVGLREIGALPVRDALIDLLRPRQLLLILDNVEQLVEAAPDVGRLLSACPRLAVLATSREPLRLSGEAEYQVAPLPLPRRDRALDVEQLRANSSVALFVQRARLARPGFDVNDENASTIVAICERLDGLPLAIELAAARSRLLTPQALLDRLQQPLHFLTGGARDLPDRQRTMRDTIQWSYDLLSDDEQRLFQRLGVFVGGWSIESAAAVCDADGDLGIDVLDGIASLLEKSLVVERVHDDGESRFTMLETIREYAETMLAQCGEADIIRLRLAEYLEDIARAIEQGMADNITRLPQMSRMDANRDNLRSILQWCLTTGPDELLRRQIGLSLAVHTWDYWDTVGAYAESADWLERFAVLDERLPASLRAKAFARAGDSARENGDVQRAIIDCESALEIAERADDPLVGMEARSWLAMALTEAGQLEYAKELLHQTLALSPGMYPGTGIWYTSVANMGLQRIALAEHDYERALKYTDAVIEDSDIPYLLSLKALVSATMATAALGIGDFDTAKRYAWMAAHWAQAIDYFPMEQLSHIVIARVAHERGELAHVRSEILQGLRVMRAIAIPGATARDLDIAAVCIAEAGFGALTARILGATENVFAAFLDDVRPSQRQRAEASARAALGDTEFERIYLAAHGTSMDVLVQQVIDALKVELGTTTSEES